MSTPNTLLQEVSANLEELKLRISQLELEVAAADFSSYPAALVINYSFGLLSRVSGYLQAFKANYPHANIPVMQDIENLLDFKIELHDLTKPPEENFSDKEALGKALLAPNLLKWMVSLSEEVEKVSSVFTDVMVDKNNEVQLSQLKTAIQSLRDKMEIAKRIFHLP